MKLRTATIRFELKEGMPSFSNRTASVVLDFEVGDEDTKPGMKALKSRIIAAQIICENLVAESIVRTRGAEPAAITNGTPSASPDHFYDPTGKLTRRDQFPVAPAMPPARQSPARSGRGSGPPKNAKTFAGWVTKGEGKEYKDRATKLCQGLGYPTYFGDLTDDEAMFVYHSLVAVPASQPAWGGNGDGQNGRG